MKQMPKQLREVSAVRCVGFNAAVADLGTHRMYGYDVPYSRGMVYNVLKGKATSRKLLERIAEKRPDLFGLWFVCEEVKAWWNDRAIDGAARKGEEVVEDGEATEDEAKEAV